jgi:hypothetical protein
VSSDRGPSLFSGPSDAVNIFAETSGSDDEFDLGDDDFDVPSFLR